jgi:FdhD protein
LVGQLYETQPLYQQSGGVHTSALSDGEALIVWAEDVGRHNTLDKIAGKILLQSLTIPHPLVLTTGRISSEMLQKASRLGAPIVISRTAPTSLSIQLAEKGGITLIGYARRDRFNVYTHPQRILPSPTIVNVKENHAQTNLQTD